MYERKFDDKIKFKYKWRPYQDRVLSESYKYLKEDYERIITNSFGTIEDVEIKSAEMIMIFLPILSKDEFLKYFRSRL